MGRPRKQPPVEQVEEKLTEEKLTEEVSNADGRHKFQRDQYGLLKEVNYIFKEDGTIDWKEMIPSEYIVVNKDFFSRKNIPIPSSTEGLDDKQKLVLLGGIKEVAKLRGLFSRENRVIESSIDRAVVECTVKFLPNYETGGEVFTYSDVASATTLNTQGFVQIFLETIAANRAFVRAVRNALRIDIVGDDELAKQSFSSQENSGSEPWQALKSIAGEKGFNSFLSFKDKLLEKNYAAAEDWQGWKDIPINEIWKFIKQLKK